MSKFIFSMGSGQYITCVYKGKNHALDRPATNHFGNISWYKNGVYHKTDGPAVKWRNGRVEWWLNGERHRKDGPAIIHEDGSEEWWLHGKRHREDGPACVWARSGVRYYLKGIYYASKKEYMQALSRLKKPRAK
jgi:hypothetical protein